MTIVDYFDVNDTWHLKAWEELEVVGMWPEEYWDNLMELGVTFPPLWQTSILAKMGNAWLEHKLRLRGN